MLTVENSKLEKSCPIPRPVVATFDGSSLPRPFSSARGRKAALLEGRFEGKTGCREYPNDVQRRPEGSADYSQKHGRDYFTDEWDDCVAELKRSDLEHGAPQAAASPRPTSFPTFKSKLQTCRPLPDESFKRRTPPPLCRGYKEY